MWGNFDKQGRLVEKQSDPPEGIGVWLSPEERTARFPEWRQVADNAEVYVPPAAAPEPKLSVDDLALALTDAQLKIADQQSLIDSLALALTDLQLKGGVNS